MSRTTLKGTTKNSLEYAGVITLSQRINGKKVMLACMHNEGGKSLFNFLVDCLIGDYDVADIGRPKYLLLLNIDADNNISAATDADFTSYFVKPEKVYHAKKGIVRYSFRISQDKFAGSNFNAIGLYSSRDADVSNYAAICKIDPKYIDGISLSYSLVLDWELHISNGEQHISNNES